MSLEGQQLDRYRILRLLGSGGMGEVYLAEDARIEQRVAIKVIRAEVSPYPDAQASQEAARLFQREARAIVKLDHPHILPLYDYGEDHLGKLTVIYLVMPYRQEGSLSDWLHQRGQAGLLSPQEVAHIVRQAASALQHAHDRQIVHQDVKPSNFLIRHRPDKPGRPDLLLADFGVAKLNTATASASQTVRGTPTYMAPEQWASQPVPATDQYALAVMAYELLTGHPPFQGSLMQVMYQHVHTSPLPPSSVNPHLAAEVDMVLLHALAKPPEERFASMTAFANAFQQAVQSMPDVDAPTSREAIPPSANPGDLRAVLAISTQEAQSGTTRTLTLPGGRRVTVTVPAGARDGQIVRLEGQGDVSPAGGPAGALILSIVVKAAEEPPPLSTGGTTGAEETLLISDPATPAPSAPIISGTGQQATASNTTQPELSMPPSSEVSPTERATSASQALFPSSELALSSEPSLERVDERTSPKQSEQRAEVVPADQASQSPARVEPQQRGISRRTVVVGLAGLMVVGATGGGLLWLARSQQPAAQVSPSVPPTSIPTPTPTPSPTPLPVGTTLYTYRGFSSSPYALAWSPNGKRIASGGYVDPVQVWDAADGGHVFTYRGHSIHTVFAVAWSPDGKRIASGSSDHTVQVWDATDGGHVFTYRGHADTVTAVAWSPDGKRIASASGDDTVQVWDAADGGNVYTYGGHSDFVNAVAWSPNGKRIASGSGGYTTSDHTVQVWDAADGGHVFTYHGHSDRVLAVAWSPNGKRIASASIDKTVQVWNAADGGHVFTYRGHADSVNAVAWSPNGKRIASAGKDVQVWDAADGGNVYTYGDGLAPVAWSPDGKRIASATYDHTVQVWVAE